MPNLFARAKAWLLGGRARRAPTFGPFSGSRPPRSGYVGYESPIRDVWYVTECRLRVSMRAQPIQFIKTLSHKVDGSDRLAAIQNSLAGLTIPRDLETQKRATPHHELNRHQTDGHLTRPIAPRRAQVRIAAAEEWQRKAAMCEQSGIRAWIRGLPPR
jgi:hypothetical protein